MTVDVEDYFQVAAFEKYIPRETWNKIPCRVEANTDRILALMEKRGVKATFFMLGWIAKRYPSLVRRIVSGGHELASHGMNHVRVTQQNPKEFFKDASDSKRLLEDIGGEAVIGYRASTYSIGADNLWAFDGLRQAGYLYSSSIYPIHHDLYGMPEGPRFSFFPRRGKKPEDDGVLEIPITTLMMFNQRIPCGGGGYFRLFPYPFSRWAWNRVNHQDCQPGVFYFHPWELDPEQPKIQGICRKTRFRHYLNLNRMQQRVDRLFQDFSWDRLDRIFQDQIPQEFPSP